LAALALAGCNLTLRDSPARVRYAVSCLFLMVLLALPVLTFTFSMAHAPDPATGGAWKQAAAVVVPPANRAPSAIEPRFQESVAPFLPWIVAAWISGVILLSLRWIGAWTCLRRLRRAASLAIPPEWDAALRSLMRRAAVSAPVRLSISPVAQVPCVIGWLRPVILMPAAALAGLDWQAVEALLAHELAHIRRHDYVVNLLQTLLDTLLFYHPAVWWVSRQIRMERENCCDDIAAEICGDRVTYARALVNLEEFRAGRAAFALSAAGGSLIQRIQRLLSGAPQQHSPAWPSALAGLAIVTCMLAGLHPAVHASGAGQQPNPQQLQPTTPKPVTIAAASPAPQASPAPETPPAKPEKSRDFLTGMVAVGFRNLTVDQLIELKIHGVTPEFASAIKQAGFAGVTPDELIQLQIHGVDPALIRSLKATGLSNLSIDDLVSLSIHGVTPGFIAEMKTVGYSGLSADEYQQMRIHGVDAAFVRHLDESGFHKVSVEQLIRLKLAGL
jgi:beta-lactamase regulating signal transducer with metallopeptidase domain